MQPLISDMENKKNKSAANAAVKKSREKRKRLINEKQNEKDFVESEVNQLDAELNYEKEKQIFLNSIKDKNIENLSFAEKETLRNYLN